MKIKNHTKWNTEDLRKLFTECCRKIGVESEHRTVEVRTGRYSGRGSLNGRWASVSIPKIDYMKGTDGRWSENPDFRPDAELIASTFTHELRHNQGLNHEDMLDREDTAWANGFTVGRQPVKAKQAVDWKAVRHQTVLQKIKEKETKLKRLQNSLKKLYARRKYYERKAASMPPA